MHENEQLFELHVHNKVADIDFKPSSFTTNENKIIDNKQFGNRNQMINKFLKNSSAFHLVDKIFQEIYNNLTNQEGILRDEKMILIKRK